MKGLALGFLLNIRVGMIAKNVFTYYGKNKGGEYTHG